MTLHEINFVMLLIQTAILILLIGVVLRFAVRRHLAMTQFGSSGSVPRPTTSNATSRASLSSGASGGARGCRTPSVLKLSRMRPWSWLRLRRDSATGCEVTAEFRKIGERGLAIPKIPCRWSAARQPLTPVPVQVTAPDDEAAPYRGGTLEPPPSLMPQHLYATIFDRQAVAEGYRLDIAPHKEGSRSGCRHSGDGKGEYGFSAESYGYPTFAKPEWRLENADYQVTVVARSGQVTKTGVFSLTYLEDDFSKFNLRPTD